MSSLVGGSGTGSVELATPALRSITAIEIAEQEIALKPVHQHDDDAKHRKNKGINPKRNKARKIKRNGFVWSGQIYDNYNDDDRKYRIDQGFQPSKLPAFPLQLAGACWLGCEPL